jgi:phage baseplate assembly protein gpV
MTHVPSMRTFQAGLIALAEVTSVRDPENQSRIEIKLLTQTGFADQNATVWANVAVPFAADRNGAFLIPDVGSQVVVGFLDSDPRYPVVLGAIWHGGAQAPETTGDTVDCWSFTGKAGTRIAIEEKTTGRPTIKLSTPGGVRATLTDMGNRLTCTAGGSTVTLSPSGVKIETGGLVEVQASMMKLSAGMVSVEAGLSTFSGVLMCDTLISTTVVASTYTPGAGNVW